MALTSESPRPATALRRFDTLFIGGEWVAPRSGRRIRSIDPATEEVWAEVAEADAADVDDAVAAARAALHGPWSRLTPSQRGELMLRLAALMRRDAAALAEIESRDNGKPLRDTKSEIARAADWITFFAGAADKINGAQIPFRPDALAYTRREPVGVVAAILPWNSPISLCSWKLGPALAAGNTLVLKPAEQTPASLLALAALVAEAGFPAGVVNVVPGFGEIAGAALVAHKGVAKVSFTGDHRTAQKIMQAGAATLKRCTFECGGKSPYIVFADADIEKALTVALHSAFRSTGQSCSAGSRIFVERPLARAFAERMAERAQRIRTGDPLDPKTHIGPQTSAEQLAKTERYIALGREAGGHVLSGGRRPPHQPRGYFIEPTVFVDVENTSRLAQEEVFGPVAAVMPFDDEDHAVALANDTDYGLVGGLWTSDVSRAHRVAHRIEAGLVSVNTFRPVHWMLPYGGYKMSGIGRENGLEVLHEYTQTKTVVVELATGAPADPFAD
ncbi:aldehyde dehydrogenase family protein [Aquabacter spiritensis]|uniref:Aldehyde dehydrogenase (NAD+) n=1 Tax=Aquabacter spiritensis TaxID=933073 RepID=A0A4R3LTN8_9HYPH|nr:aldehyde dehydrogenase family protein [Aquabacter spiritensis]TCT03286.1 aldehyde dehydrogenase (NAD+) [Aquabacter spiritensis]